MLIAYSCASSKPSDKPKLDDTISFISCDKLFPINDIEDENSILNDINNLSYSGMYTIIHTLKPKTDSLEKNNIRYQYNGKIKSKISEILPNVTIEEKNPLINKSFQYIWKIRNSFFTHKRHVTSNIEKITSDASNKQLYIISEYIQPELTINETITIYIFIFDPIKKELLYTDRLKYNCDIRDYKSLERALSYGLYKVKENFQ